MKKCKVCGKKWKEEKFTIIPQIDEWGITEGFKVICPEKHESYE